MCRAAVFAVSGFTPQCMKIEDFRLKLACGMGIGAASAGLSVGNSFNAVCSELQKQKHTFIGDKTALATLPPIANQMSNGSIIDIPGNKVYTMSRVLKKRTSYKAPSTAGYEQGAATYLSVDWPGVGKLEADPKYFTNIGLTTDIQDSCAKVGEQRCVPSSQTFVTCTSNGKWSVAQACGAGSTCRDHPDNDDRVVCVW